MGSTHLSPEIQCHYSHWPCNTRVLKAAGRIPLDVWAIACERVLIVGWQLSPDSLDGFCNPRHTGWYLVDNCLETWHRICRTWHVLHGVGMSVIQLVKLGARINLLITFRATIVKIFMTYLTQHFSVNLCGMHLMRNLTFTQPVLLSFGINC